MKKIYYDLTENLNNNTIVYPGDPKFTCNEISSLKNGDKFRLCHFHLGNHTGTHIDYPSHVFETGKNSSDYSIEDHVGIALIIDLTSEEGLVNDIMLLQYKDKIKKCDFVFFKTKNSISGVKNKFSDNYVYIDISAAKFITELGVKIVGIDYLSVDSFDDGNLTIHKTFLEKNILIIENLKLICTEQGFYKTYILPLKVENMDGLPVRILAEKLT